VREALGTEAGAYWVRFYRESEGWRFDLEHHQKTDLRKPTMARADESVVLHVYTLLVESGKPLDPGWRPFSEPPPTPAVVTTPAPAPLGEAPPPLAKAAVAPTAPPDPVPETKTEAVSATLTAPVLQPEPFSEPLPPPAPRPPWWRSLRPAIVYLPAVLLVAFAGWLSRDRLQSRPASPPASSPPATVSPEALTAEKRLKELEAVVAQLTQERAQVVPGRRAAAPAPIRPTQRASGPPLTPPVEGHADEILAPTPAPEPTPAPVTAPAAEPTPTDALPPADLPASTDAAVTTAPVPAAAAEPPPSPSLVQPGAMVYLNEPGLTLPVLLTQTRPRYPPVALERRLSGTVSLKALIDETGAVVEVSLIRASPKGLFEGAATSYVRTRRYRPATLQGVPVRVWLPIVVEFRIPGQ
jgi:protein TonB